MHEENNTLHRKYAGYKIIEKRKEVISDDFKVLGLGFSAKKNLCIN